MATGSPIAKTNAAQGVIETSEYEPYGKLLNRANDNRAGFTGHVMDSASGVAYMQQRYYDPGSGRFLSVDPVTANSVTGSNFNRYWYANNNPYKFTDPDGRRLFDPYLLASGYGDASELGSQSEPGSRSNQQQRGSSGQSYTGAPTSKIDEWMKSGDARDRVKAALEAIKIFKIKTHGEKLAVTTRKGGVSGNIVGNQVQLFAEAFTTWPWLGSVLGHEFEGHHDGLDNSDLSNAKSEVNAYRYNLENAGRFGNSFSEMQKYRQEYQRAIEVYERWKKYSGE